MELLYIFFMYYGYLTEFKKRRLCVLTPQIEFMRSKNRSFIHFHINVLCERIKIFILKVCHLLWAQRSLSIFTVLALGAEWRSDRMRCDFIFHSMFELLMLWTFLFNPQRGGSSGRVRLKSKMVVCAFIVPDWLLVEVWLSHIRSS